MRRKVSIAFLLLFLFGFIFSLFPNSDQIIHAWGGVDWDEYLEELEDDGLGKNNLETGSSTRSYLAEDGEQFFYRLEAKMPDKDKSKWFNLPGKTADAVSTAINETIMLLNKIVFWINMQVGKFAVGLLEKANDFGFIDHAISKISLQVRNLVGISGTKFTSSGMFLPILKMISLLVVVYAFYQLVWKRSFIASFGEMLKFVVVLTTSLLLFANYSTFLSGMNDLSQEIGEFVVGASGSAKSSAQESRIATFNETLWEHFVDKPYLTLQYGTNDLEKIGNGDVASGEERVRALLTARTGSDYRAYVVNKEVNELENYYMTYDSVVEKTSLNFSFLGLNLLTSIPVFIISLAIIFTQFWFVIIALIAPFALLIASFPTQFNVLKRYFFELSLPLLIKIGLHFALVIIIILTSLLAEVESELHSDMFSGHLGTAFMNAIFYSMLFFGVFILRKRITGIMTSGSQMMGEIREGMSSVTTKPAKQGIQTAGTVAGAGIGFAKGGVAGMAMGANIGSTVGKVVSGESDGLGGATRDLSKVAYQTQVMKSLSSNKSSDSETNTDNSSNSITDHELQQSSEDSIDDVDVSDHQLSQMENLSHQELEEQGMENLNQFSQTEGMNDDQRDNLYETMKAEGVDFSKIKEQTLNRANVQEQDKITSPKDYNQKVENGINTLEEFGNEHNLNQNELKEVKTAMKNEGVDFAKLDSQMLENSNVKGEEIKNPRTFAQNVKKQQALKGQAISNPEEFAKNIKQHQEMEAEKVSNLRNKREEKFDNYLKEQNLNANEIQEIHSHLEDKGIDVAHIPTNDYVQANNDIRSKLEKGESVDYTKEFNKKLEERVNQRKLEKQSVNTTNEGQQLSSYQLEENYEPPEEYYELEDSNEE